MSTTRRDAQEGVATVTTATGASDDLGIEALYRRWVALRDDINTTKGRSDEETEPLSEAQISVEHQIAKTPARSLHGVLVKLRLHIDQYAAEDLAALDRIQLSSALADLERLAGVAVVSSDPPLMERILELEPALTDLEGASSALSGAASEEVSHDCELGVVWLSGKIEASVQSLREQFEALHLAAGGSS